jgi:hypothetical protein
MTRHLGVPVLSTPTAAVAFKTALGTQVATTTATTTVITTTAAIAVGDLVVVRIASDNASATTPTFTCADSGSNIYSTLVQKAVGASTAGVAGAIMVSKATNAVSSGGTITITQSVTEAARAAYAESFTGCSATARSLPTSASGSAGTAAASGSSSTVASGDLVVGLVCAETQNAATADSDTTDGTWSTMVSLSNASGGTDTTRVQANGQYKIATGTTAQNYGNTIGATTDWIAMVVILVPSVSSAARWTNAGAQGYDVLAVGLGAGNWTVCGWFKLASVLGDVPFLAIDHASGGYIQIVMDSGGTTLKRDTSVSGQNFVAMAINVWYFAAMTWISGTNDRNYYMVAGAGTPTELTYSAVDPTIADTWAFRLATNKFGSRGPVSIAAVKAWTTALTQAEINAEVSTYAPVKTANLWANWTFASGASTTDNSGNGHTLTLTGAVATDNSGPPIT